MLSLLDLYNMREGKQPGSDLLEFYQGNGQAPEPQVIDRATLLPIGQYEDGSLTLAWPGILKDAYEGAVRSYEQGRQLPRADEEGYYAGTPRAEPLDAFNAASLAPIAGVGARAAGFADDVARPAATMPYRAEDGLAVADVPYARDLAAPARERPPRYDPEFGIAADDTLTGDVPDAVRAAYESRSPVPEGWWVHGQFPHRGVNPYKLRDQNIQLTRDYDVMEMFGQKPGSKTYDPDPGPGGGFAVRPKPDARVLDFSSQNTPDLDRFVNGLIADYERGNLPPKITEELSIAVSPGKTMDSWLRSRFAPPNIVDKARAFDHNEWADLLLPYGDFVLTPDGAVALRKEAVDSVRLFSNPTESSLPYLMTNALEQAASDAPKGIRAYHGSPHDFDRFSTAHIGRGEGNASYGNGLYFADSEDVAKSYRDSLAPDGGGRMYEVNINAQPEQFLDWTKSLDEQSPFVQDAVNRIAERLPPHQRPFATQAGKSTYSNLADAADIPSEHAAAPLLREAGVPGIRYLDASSRAGGPGSYNYAVFDDSLIDIVRKYANPETASLPYLMTNGMEGDGAAYAELDPSTPPPYRLPGDVGESSDLMQILKDNNMLGNGQLPPRPPFRLWPEVTPEDQFWQQFHDEQLYKDMKREDIPPNFRPPLEVPDIDPVFPEDRWYRRIR